MSTPYERRLALAAAAILAHTGMTRSGAERLAAHVLHAVDTIPETLR